MTATLQRNATPQRTATPAASHGIWTAVDALTQPTQVPIERDNGHTNWAEVPSLWQQAQTLLRRAVDRSHAGSPARERSPLDLDLLEITAQIHETVSHELQTRGLLRSHRRAGDETRLRRLAAHVIGHEPGRLWWWEHLFASWSRLLARCLKRRRTPARTGAVTQLAVPGSAAPGRSPSTPTTGPGSCPRW